MAKLVFRYGSMGSTKSLNLLTTAYNLEENDISIICFKPDVYSKGGINDIVTRIIGTSVKRECRLLLPTDNLYDIIYNHVITTNDDVKYILIDECHFLKEKQINQLSKIVDELNIDVICFGLRTDFTSHLFEGSRRLFEISDKIEEIKSYCQCGSRTIVNARLSEQGDILVDGEQVLLGENKELYLPLCRKCWGKIN
ncbi:MAG: thymidine kinase [Novosphingobium sp.]|nr:thymidine kinase [Novosphingobium sp.]